MVALPRSLARGYPYQNNKAIPATAKKVNKMLNVVAVNVISSASIPVSVNFGFIIFIVIFTLFS